MSFWARLQRSWGAGKYPWLTGTHWKILKMSWFSRSAKKENLGVDWNGITPWILKIWIDLDPSFPAMQLFHSQTSEIGGFCTAKVLRNRGYWPTTYMMLPRLSHLHSLRLGNLNEAHSPSAQHLQAKPSSWPQPPYFPCLSSDRRVSAKSRITETTNFFSSDSCERIVQAWELGLGQELEEPLIRHIKRMCIIQYIDKQI